MEMVSSLQDASTFKDEMVVSIATGLVSVTSRASMTVLVIGGVVHMKLSSILEEKLRFSSWVLPLSRLPKGSKRKQGFTERGPF